MIYDYHKSSIGDIKQLAASRNLKIHTLAPNEEVYTREIMLRMYKFAGKRSTIVPSMLFSVFEYGKIIGDGMRVSKPVELLTRPYYGCMRSCTDYNICTNFHYISGPYIGSILYGYSNKSISHKDMDSSLQSIYSKGESCTNFTASSSVFFVTDSEGYPYLFLGRRYGQVAVTKKMMQDLCAFADSMGCGLLLGANHRCTCLGSPYNETVCTPRYVSRASSTLGGYTSGAEYYDNLVPKSTKLLIGGNLRNAYKFQIKVGMKGTTRVLFKPKTPISYLSFHQQNLEFSQYQQTIKELVSA